MPTHGRALALPSSSKATSAPAWAGASRLPRGQAGAGIWVLTCTPLPIFSMTIMFALTIGVIKMAFAYLMGRNDQGEVSRGYIPIGGDPTQLKLTDMTQDDGAIIIGSTNTGREIDPTHLPKAYYTDNTRLAKHPLYDCEVCSMGPIVNKRFRDCLEAYEPNQHQFITVQVLARDAKQKFKDDHNPTQDEIDTLQLVEERYIFVPTHRLDTIHRMHTTPLNERGFWMGNFGVEDQQIVLNPSQIGSAHAWYDKFAMRQFFSNAFAQYLMDQTFTGIRMFEVAEHA